MQQHAQANALFHNRQTVPRALYWKTSPTYRRGTD
jgi:hypothetical protein